MTLCLGGGKAGVTQNGKLGSFLWKPFRSLSWNIFSPHEFH